MSEKKYRLAITHTPQAMQAVATTLDGEEVATSTLPYARAEAPEGWIGYQGREIVDGMCSVAVTVLGLKDCEAPGDYAPEGGIDYRELESVTISSSEDATVVWEAPGGLPIVEALEGADTRSETMRERLQAALGRPVDGASNLVKVAWILDNIEGARTKAEAGELLWGTPRAWLHWALTGGIEGGTHVVTLAEAKASGMYNETAGTWDAATLAAAGIPDSMMPEIASGSTLGHCRSDGVMPGVPILEPQA